MSAQPTGGVREKTTARGPVFGLRFTAYGQRRYVTLPDGTTRQDAERELRGVLADVERGTWQPPKPAPVIEVEADRDPTFHEFASDWFEASKGEWSTNTVLAYESELVNHLLPFFRDHRLSQITVAEVDRYRQHKVAQGKLAASSINKTITRLGQVLELADERELVPRNAVKVGGRRRKLRAPKPPRPFLDRAEQIEALLTAAAELDAEAKSNGRVYRRAQIASLIYAGPRISEHIAFDWRVVDLAACRFSVEDSKTDAGVRYLDMLPVLRDELAALKAEQNPKPSDPVFPTQRGGRTNPSNFRTRILAKAVERANENLAGQGNVSLPANLTPHALRRTFCSLLFAIGRDVPYVMAQMGHSDPSVTLGIYAKVMSMKDDDRARLRALVEGVEVVPSGTRAESEPHRPTGALTQ